MPPSDPLQIPVDFTQDPASKRAMDRVIKNISDSISGAFAGAMGKIQDLRMDRRLNNFGAAIKQERHGAFFGNIAQARRNKQFDKKLSFAEDPTEKAIRQVEEREKKAQERERKRAAEVERREVKAKRWEAQKDILWGANRGERADLAASRTGVKGKVLWAGGMAGKAAGGLGRVIGGAGSALASIFSSNKRWSKRAGALDDTPGVESSEVDTGEIEAKAKEAVEVAKKAAKKALDKDSTEDEKKFGLFHQVLYGKTTWKNRLRDTHGMIGREIASAGFSNLAAGWNQIPEKGIMGGMSTAVGGGLIDLLTSGYKIAASNSSAMINLAGLVGTQGASAARGYSVRYGFNPREKAGLGSQYGSQVGRLNKDSMHAMMYAERMGNMGGQFAGLAGALEQTGSMGGGSKQATKLLGEGVASAIFSRLDRGRWKEVFAGWAQIAKSMPLGYGANKASMMGMTGMLGQMGPGFRGSRGIQAMQMLDRMSKGQGGPLSDITSLMSAGLGQKGFFEASRGRESGIFSNTGGGVERLRSQFDTTRQMVPHSGLRQYMLSKETGMTMEAIRKLENLFGSLKPGESTPAAMAAKVAEIQTQEKPLRQRAYEGMAKFGGFKQIELRMEQLQDTIGRIIAPTMLKIFSTLLDIAENTLGTFLATGASSAAAMKRINNMTKGQGFGQRFAGAMAKGGLIAARLLHSMGIKGPYERAIKNIGGDISNNYIEQEAKRKEVRESLNKINAQREEALTGYGATKNRAKAGKKGDKTSMLFKPQINIYMGQDHEGKVHLKRIEGLETAQENDSQYGAYSPVKAG